MPKEHLIVIDEEGNIQTLYDDSLLGLGVWRRAPDDRASTVEPGADGWDVVLTDHPANGSYKGHVVGRGYATRKEALDAEVAFIQANILSGGN